MVMTKSTSNELVKLNCSCFLLLLIFFFTASCFSTPSLPNSNALPSYAENEVPSIDHLNNFPVASNTQMRSSIKEAPGTDTLLRGRKMKPENAKSTSSGHSGSGRQHRDQINTNPKLASVKKHYEEKEQERKRLNGGISDETPRSDKRTGDPVRTPTSTSGMDSFVPCADYNVPHRHPPKNN